MTDALQGLSRAGRHLTPLVRAVPPSADDATARKNRDSTIYEINPASAVVWVLYIGTSTMYAGIYTADARPYRFAGDALALVEKKATWTVGQMPTLPEILRQGLNLLGDLVTDIATRNAQGEPGLVSALSPDGLTVALPAALDLKAEKVVGAEPAGWADEPAGTPELIQRYWRQIVRHRLPLAIPDCGDSICVESDVVCDAMSAMYPSRRSLPPTDEVALSRHRVVLGVKHSEAIRSACITRGQPDLHLLPNQRRRPGVRRDSVFRGAHGDTQGLGHLIALVKRSAADAEDRWVPDDLADVQTIAQFAEDEKPVCTCKATEPHLQAVASLRVVRRRLGIADEAATPYDAWKSLEDAIRDGDQRGRVAELVLGETGRLIAHAIGMGVRLYDPDAIIVTGMLSYNDTMWNELRTQAAPFASEEGTPRMLMRNAALPDDSSTTPTGPMGAAWLALDTWAFPTLLDHRWPESG